MLSVNDLFALTSLLHRGTEKRRKKGREYAFLLISKAKTCMSNVKLNTKKRTYLPWWLNIGVFNDLRCKPFVLLL